MNRFSNRHLRDHLRFLDRDNSQTKKDEEERDCQQLPHVHVQRELVRKIRRMLDKSALLAVLAELTIHHRRAALPVPIIGMLTQKRVVIHEITEGVAVVAERPSDDRAIFLNTVARIIVQAVANTRNDITEQKQWAEHNAHDREVRTHDELHCFTQPACALVGARFDYIGSELSVQIDPCKRTNLDWKYHY